MLPFLEKNHKTRGPAWNGSRRRCYDYMGKPFRGAGGIFDLYELVPGFAAGLIAIFPGSIFDKSGNKEVFAEYDKISASYKQKIK